MQAKWTNKTSSQQHKPNSSRPQIQQIKPIDWLHANLLKSWAGCKTRITDDCFASLLSFRTQQQNLSSTVIFETVQTFFHDRQLHEGLHESNKPNWCTLIIRLSFHIVNKRALSYSHKHMHKEEWCASSMTCSGCQETLGKLAI